MKRSEINKALKELEAMCKKEHCYLPPFCHFTPEQWQDIGHEYDEVRDCMLGWDITDYGLGDFNKVGMSLITIRNGNRAMADKYPKVYAEKLLYMKEGQYSPNHFHWYKTEDIINRGGGNILIRVYNSLPDESIDRESDVTVHCDGRTYTVPAGTQVRLTSRSPARRRRSSSVCGLWLPSANTRVISALSTPPAYISSSRAGMTLYVGMGRVTSLVTITTFSPGFTMSRSAGDPIGSLSARRTSASPVRPRSTSFGRSTPTRFLSGTVTRWTPLPKPSSNSILFLRERDFTGGQPERRAPAPAAAITWLHYIAKSAG